MPYRASMGPSEVQVTLDAVIVAVCLNDIPELQNNLTRPPAWLSALHGRSALVRRLLALTSESA